MWLARENDGKILLFTEKPFYNEFLEHWSLEVPKGMFLSEVLVTKTLPINDIGNIDLTFENSPMEVKLTKVV